MTTVKCGATLRFFVVDFYCFSRVPHCVLNDYFELAIALVNLCANLGQFMRNPTQSKAISLYPEEFKAVSLISFRFACFALSDWKWYKICYVEYQAHNL